MKFKVGDKVKAGTLSRTDPAKKGTILERANPYVKYDWEVQVGSQVFLIHEFELELEEETAMKASKLRKLIKDDTDTVSDLVQRRSTYGTDWHLLTVSAGQWEQIFWFLEHVTEDFEISGLRIKPQPETCNGKVVEIDGKSYKLTEIGE